MCVEASEQRNCFCLHACLQARCRAGSKATFACVHPHDKLPALSQGQRFWRRGGDWPPHWRKRHAPCCYAAQRAALQGRTPWRGSDLQRCVAEKSPPGSSRFCCQAWAGVWKMFDFNLVCPSILQVAAERQQWCWNGQNRWKNNRTLPQHVVFPGHLSQADASCGPSVHDSTRTVCMLATCGIFDAVSASYFTSDYAIVPPSSFFPVRLVAVETTPCCVFPQAAHTNGQTKCPCLSPLA